MKLKSLKGRKVQGYDLAVCAATRCSRVEGLVIYKQGLVSPDSDVALCSIHVDVHNKEMEQQQAAGQQLTEEVKAQKTGMLPPGSDIVQQKMEGEATEGKELLALVQSYEMHNQDDVDFANECLAETKAKLKILKAERDKVVSPLNTTLKVVRGWFKLPMDFYAEAEKLWKAKIKIGMFQLQAREQAALEAASIAHQAGNLNQVTDMVTVATEANVALPDNTSMVEHWTYKVDNDMLVPREYLMLDIAKIAQVVRAMKDQTNIPGIRAIRDDYIQQRS